MRQQRFSLPLPSAPICLSLPPLDSSSLPTVSAPNIGRLFCREVHIAGSKLEKYGWFQRMRALHFLHHTDGMKHNYAMADFFLDVLSGNLINTV